jgi:hypothetical protein
VTGLQTALDGKSGVSHTHSASQVTDFASAVAAAAPAEVLDFQTTAQFPATGLASKIYVATDASRAYQWTGSQYAEIGPAGAFLPVHSHAASDITSGVISTARLGTGTADATTFLRGDGTFSPAVTSVDGSTGAVTIPKAQVFQFTRTSAPSDATGSSGNWTWSLPTNARIVEILAIGGGGGGGSGRRGAAGTNRFGGAGGGGATATWVTISASLITTSMNVIIGGGGAGGAARTTDDTDGSNGSNGLNTSITFGGTQWIRANAGLFGQGGSATQSSGGSANSVDQATFRGSNGGNGSVTGTAGSGFAPTGHAGCGGAAGGGIDTANTIRSPGTQNVGFNTAQSAALQSSLSTQTGGAASTTANATSGPNGPTYGHGGCGGGASANGFNSGAGGNGGDGYVRITVWY